jgi:hypothetical protein
MTNRDMALRKLLLTCRVSSDQSQLDFLVSVLQLIPREIWRQINVSSGLCIDYVSAADLRKLQPRFAAIQRLVREQVELEA